MSAAGICERLSRPSGPSDKQAPAGRRLYAYAARGKSWLSFLGSEWSIHRRRDVRFDADCLPPRRERLVRARCAQAPHSFQRSTLASVCVLGRRMGTLGKLRVFKQKSWTQLDARESMASRSVKHLLLAEVGFQRHAPVCCSRGADAPDQTACQQNVQWLVYGFLGAHFSSSCAPVT